MAERSIVSIRRAEEKDAEDIYRIHTAAIREKCSACYSKEEIKCWLTSQSRERYLPFILANEMIVAVDREQGKLVGFGHLTPVTARKVEEEYPGAEEQNSLPNQKRKTVSNKMEGEVQIKGLYVEPASGGKGVGMALMESLERRALGEGAPRMTVFSTLNAVSFYEKCGFVCKENTKHQIPGHSIQCWKMMKYLA